MNVLTVQAVYMHKENSEQINTNKEEKALRKDTVRLQGPTMDTSCELIGVDKNIIVYIDNRSKWLENLKCCLDV